MIGPQFVTPSDVLVKAMEHARLSCSIYASHYKADILEERRAQRLMRGRVAASRQNRRVRPWEC